MLTRTLPVSDRGLPAEAGDDVTTERAPGANAAGAHRRLNDDDFPAYTMGRAADMIGVTAQFLRSLGEAGLLEPQRSTGGHRRFSRHQLRLAARARELVDEGVDLAPACRIVRLEDDLEAANRRIAELTSRLETRPPRQRQR
jgi:DNA-binding transcriptional MerR regulator